MPVIHYTPWNTFNPPTTINHDGRWVECKRLRNMAQAECGHVVSGDERRQTDDTTKVTCKLCKKTLRYRQDVK